MNPVEVLRGDGPVILAQPHGGTFIPDDVLADLNDLGRSIADTDWHIGQLYDGLLPGVTVVSATFHRYVVDANRDPSGASLYPGQNTTGLVPDTDFDGRPIWVEGRVPDAAEVERRRAAFHAPYHAALAAEVERLRAIHGRITVYDCHSIRSVIPFLFEGKLPDFNVGTNSGTTCVAEVEDATRAVVQDAGAAGFDHVINGRFRGGWTTRHYGRPETGVNAIQMELAQSIYLTAEQAPWSFDAKKSAVLRPYLGEILRRIEQVMRASA